MYDRLEIILSFCEKGRTFLIRAPIDTGIQNLWKADLDLFLDDLQFITIIMIIDVIYML